MTTPPAALVDDLTALGVRAGDTLFLHASMRRIGPVEGGAAGLLGTLLDVVGADGTLLMVLGAELDWTAIGDAPGVTVDELLARGIKPLDCRTAPAMREIGVLAEVLRTFPGAVVQDHPDGRFAAVGARAKELLENTPWDHYYGPGSTLDRFTSVGGRVLRMGADAPTTTVIHYAEYLANVPDKIARTVWFLVDDGNGPVLKSCTSLDNEHGIVRWDGEDYFGLILEAFLAAGHGARGKVGNADSVLLEAKDLVPFAASWMERTFR